MMQRLGRCLLFKKKYWKNNMAAKEFPYHIHHHNNLRAKTIGKTVVC
jgi:hypothetical protein